MASKICTICDQLKDEDDFYFSYKKKYKMSECKECFRIRQKKYQKSNREAENKRKRNWVQKNRARYNNLAKQYYHNNLELARCQSSFSTYKRYLKNSGIDIKIERVPYKTMTLEFAKQRLQDIKKLWKAYKNAQKKTC